MSFNKKTERDRLFSIYAKNLTIYYPEVIDKFLCPICKQLFSRKVLHSKLSLAHIIPQSVGGSFWTLSCKQCNSEIGSNYDSHVAKEKRIENFKHGKSHLNAHLKTDQDELPVELSYPNSQLHIRNLVGQSNPKSLEKIIGDATKNWSKFNFSIELPTFSQKKRNIALIHSAFLMMFYYFGYEYVVLSSNASPIRHLILYPELWDASHNRTIITLKTTSEHHCNRPNVSILITPRESRSLLVELPPPNNSTPARCVLLPGFGEDGQEAYKHILGGSFKSENLNLKLIPYDDSRLTNPQFKWFGHKTWKYLFKI